jgi:hypothetical protein
MNLGFEDIDWKYFKATQNRISVLIIRVITETFKRDIQYCVTNKYRENTKLK